MSPISDLSSDLVWLGQIPVRVHDLVWFGKIPVAASELPPHMGSLSGPVIYEQRGRVDHAAQDRAVRMVGAMGTDGRSEFQVPQLLKLVAHGFAV